jgi:hypothetical protein
MVKVRVVTPSSAVTTVVITVVLLLSVTGPEIPPLLTGTPFTLIAALASCVVGVIVTLFVVLLTDVV